MSVKQIFDAVRSELKVTPRQRADSLNFPSGYEPGLRHPTAQGHVLCRDDAVVELSSGAGAVMVDGADAHVSVKGTAVTLEARYLHLHGEVYFGFQRFNPYWLSGPADPLSWTWRTAPLVQNFPAALEAVEFLTGVPGAGQVPVKLSAFLHAVPLFGPNEQLLALSRNLGELLKNIALPEL